MVANKPQPNAGESLIAAFAHRVAHGDKESARILFGAVSELIRSRLDPADAAVVATWFDRLAAGEKPDDVFFGERRGRKPGSLKTAFIRGEEITPPDDVTLCWAMRDRIEQGDDPAEVFKAAAKRFDRTPGYYKRLYGRILPTLGPVPK